MVDKAGGDVGDKARRGRGGRRACSKGGMEGMEASCKASSKAAIEAWLQASYRGHLARHLSSYPPYATILQPKLSTPPYPIPTPPRAGKAKRDSERVGWQRQRGSRVDLGLCISMH
jgi:hypothetical protein